MQLFHGNSDYIVGYLFGIAFCPLTIGGGLRINCHGEHMRRISHIIQLVKLDAAISVLLNIHGNREHSQYVQRVFPDFRHIISWFFS